MNLDMVESAVRAILAKYETVTPELIRDLIDQLTTGSSSTVTRSEAEGLARRLEASLDVTMTPGHMVNEPFEEWLRAARAAGMSMYYWDRYRQYLATERQFPSLVISALDQSTDKILRVLENPEKEGDWDRRGMVVGHVQSGKTANYTGLICKAADAGYKLIVVIAGIHNKLRNQTQQRIDEGFVGRDTARLQARGDDRYVGVGRLDSTNIPMTVTTRLADFNKGTAEQIAFQLRQLSAPAVFVIKKNPHTLTSVIRWLREHNAAGDSRIGDAPMLLIDDEADNASIDVSNSPDEVSRINGLIRDLLSLFRRSCYVGYTATPFANIFIDPENPKSMENEDLFPRDFIIGLDPASNYFGPPKVFGQASDWDVLRPVTDNEDVLPLKHRKADEIPDVPPSLKDAVRTFILARAIRISRGQTSAHNSMLVNVSRFNNVQAQIRNLLHEFLNRIANRIKYEAGRSTKSADPEIRSLHRVWQQEFGSTCGSWESLVGYMREAVEPIEVLTVNSQSSDSLDYVGNAKHGLNVIAVGGFSLSRGLTLEGLTVSYFLRNSMMYDTLLQMGRWFGFRPGYEDLCRIWMRPEAIEWYEHITESIQELREELREMEQNGQTPREFGLKVRSHPDTLMVTARNKMGTGKKVPVQVSLADRLVETSSLDPSEETHEFNRSLVEELMDKLRSEKPSQQVEGSGNHIWRSVAVAGILEFVESFRNHPSCMRTDGSLVGGYIRPRMDDELSVWDVVLVGNKRPSQEAATIVMGGLQVHCQKRSADFNDPLGALRVSGEKARVASRGIERIGVSEKARKRSEQAYRESEEYRNRKSGSGGAEPNFPDRIYRHVRERPLLMLHPLALSVGNGATEPQVPVVAWGISFPPSGHEGKTVEYLVNTTYWRQIFGDALDEDEANGVF